TTACRITAGRLTPSGRLLPSAGIARSGGAVNAAGSTGSAWMPWPHVGLLLPASFILGLDTALTRVTATRARCGSSARRDLCGGRLESSPTKSRPYRDRLIEAIKTNLSDSRLL